MTKYWLLKSEPDTYSWTQMEKDKTIFWDGVRNYQAQNNMKNMTVSDLAFFYHSNKGKEIVGIVEIIKTAYPDHTDPKNKFIMVDIKYVQPLKKTVSLQTIKSLPELSQMQLVKQSRLSVSSVSKEEWDIILNLSES